MKKNNKKVVKLYAGIGLLHFVILFNNIYFIDALLV
jgi:hypothetical protein